MAKPPRLLILSGPNGAGKSTFAQRLLVAQDEILPFINADVEAQKLSPADVLGAAFPAARTVLDRMAAHLDREESFAIETTLSGQHHLRISRVAVATGWFVDLHYVSLDTVDLAKQRVLERVAAGGHDIPQHVIKRRYWRGLENLPIFCDVVSRWTLHDNSGARPQLVATGDAERVIEHWPDRFEKICAVSARPWKKLLSVRERSKSMPKDQRG